MDVVPLELQPEVEAIKKIEAGDVLNLNEWRDKKPFYTGYELYGLYEFNVSYLHNSWTTTTEFFEKAKILIKLILIITLQKGALIALAFTLRSVHIGERLRNEDSRTIKFAAPIGLVFSLAIMFGLQCMYYMP